MHENPQILDSIEDISKMVVIPMSCQCKDDFVNQLKRIKFKENKSNLVTTKPFNHSLLCYESFNKEIIIDGIGDEENKPYCKHIEKEEYAVTSIEREIVRSPFFFINDIKNEAIIKLLEYVDSADTNS